MKKVKVALAVALCMGSVAAYGLTSNFNAAGRKNCAILRQMKATTSNNQGLNLVFKTSDSSYPVVFGTVQGTTKERGNCKDVSSGISVSRTYSAKDSDVLDSAASFAPGVDWDQ